MWCFFSLVLKLPVVWELFLVSIMLKKSLRRSIYSFKITKVECIYKMFHWMIYMWNYMCSLNFDRKSQSWNTEKTYNPFRIKQKLHLNILEDKANTVLWNIPKVDSFYKYLVKWLTFMCLSNTKQHQLEKMTKLVHRHSQC